MTIRHNKLKLFIDKALSNSLGRQIAILAAILVASLVLSYLFLSFSGSDWKGFCGKNHLSPWLLPIYLLIDTNALNTLYIGGNVHGWMLFACSITYLIGLFIFNGMIIGIITNAIELRVKKHNDGLLHYLKSGHYIIMGYDDMVPSIITDIFAKETNADVLIMTSLDANIVREKLLRSVARDKMDQIFINYGHRAVKDDYKAIHLEASKEIYIVGNRTRPAHDAINVECLDSIRAYFEEGRFQPKPKRIICVFEDLDTYAAFKTTEIFGKIGSLGIDLIPYNFYTGWAMQVFVRRYYLEKNNPVERHYYPTVYKNGITPDDKKFVHLVFIGTSNFSVAFAMEAANLLHFPNFEGNNSLKTRITFIEKNADEELLLFATRNRHYFEVQPYYYEDISSEKLSIKKSRDGSQTYTVVYNPRIRSRYTSNLLSTELSHYGFLDVEFEFIKGDVFANSVQKKIKEWATSDDQYLSIFLAMSDQRSNFIMGMNMPDEVYDNAVPVFIRQDRADDFVTNLRNEDNSEIKYYSVVDKRLKETKRKGRYAHIYPFGMDDMAYCSDDGIMKQAKLINYLYSVSSNYHFPDTLVLNAMSAETLWREAEEKWKTLKVAEKWSNLYVAYSIPCKLDSLRAMRGLEQDDHSKDISPLSYEELEHIAAVEHNRWNVEKLLMGYRKARPNEDRYNHPVYSDEFKKNKKQLFIHSDIRPFKDLDDIKQYDYDIAKYTPWILEMTLNEQNNR